DLFRHGEEARLDFILSQTIAILEEREILVLKYAAQLAPDAVPLDCVRQLVARHYPEIAEGGNSAAELWTSIIERLLAFRLLQRQKNSSSVPFADAAPPGDDTIVTMHRLVQDVVRAWDGHDAQSRSEAVAEMIRSACVLLRDQWHNSQHRWFFPVVRA